MGLARTGSTNTLARAKLDTPVSIAKKTSTIVQERHVQIMARALMVSTNTHALATLGTLVLIAKHPRTAELAEHLNTRAQLQIPVRAPHVPATRFRLTHRRVVPAFHAHAPPTARIEMVYVGRNPFQISLPSRYLLVPIIANFLRPTIAPLLRIFRIRNIVTMESAP